DKMNYPKGLIRYTTQNALAGVATRILRPRVLVYGAILVAALVAVLFGLVNRDPVGLDVIRDRNALYRETSDGWIENVYTLKILNMDETPRIFDVDISGIDGARLVEDGDGVEVGAGSVVSYVVRVQVDPDALERQSTDFIFAIEARDDATRSAEESARFVGPRWIGEIR